LANRGAAEKIMNYIGTLILVPVNVFLYLNMEKYWSKDKSMLGSISQFKYSIYFISVNKNINDLTIRHAKSNRTIEHMPRLIYERFEKIVIWEWRSYG
jgi:hypothetical protein